jgi:hypothetical protein
MIRQFIFVLLPVITSRGTATSPDKASISCFNIFAAMEEMPSALTKKQFAFGLIILMPSL